MPWKETNKLEQRIEFVIRALQKQEKMGELCLEYGIHRSTGYEWLNRYRGSGKDLRSLLNRSSRPHSSPFRTGKRETRAVIRLRRKYGWGGKKLRERLVIEEEIELSVPTINRILKREGLISRKDSHPPAPQRFEKGEPNELWQMDFKGEFKDATQWCYPFTLLDDHSRFSLGIKAMDRPQANNVKSHLVKVFERFGKPQAILTDHGSQWWSNTNGHGLTHLSVFLLKQDIELIYSSVGHPQTQGKIERYHRTLKNYVSHHGRPTGLMRWQRMFNRFVKEYNEIRPHESLGMAVPSSRYRPSLRKFRLKPRAWEYESGADVRKLSVHGCLPYRGQYHFVCEALAHEWVRVDRFDENRLLVTFRKFPIREINLMTGETTAVVSPDSYRKLSGMS